MDTLWRWFYRLVVAVGLGFLLMAWLLSLDVSRQSVQQSDGYVAPSTALAEITLSNGLPESATQFRFCRASVGLGGRLLLYRFSAPIDDLHAHAVAELEAHWEPFPYDKVAGAISPFSERNVERNSDFYGGDAGWMLPPADAVGTIYIPADRKFSHRPTIYVDETNGVLYFQMTD